MNKIAIITKEKEYTYYEIKKKVDEFADQITTRELIFILCHNSIESIVGYAASVQNETVPLLLSSKLTDEKYMELIYTYLPRYIWCENIRDMQVMVKSSVGECAITVEAIYQADNYVLYSLQYDNVEENEKLYHELALLLSTSGSTGNSKLVRISYNNLKSNTEAIIESIGISSKDVTITTLPMNYTYGLSVINTHLSAGATIVLNEDSVISKSFWDKMKAHKVTSIAGVPYTYDMLKKLRIDKLSLSHLRMLTQAGGGMSIGTRRYLQDYCERCDKKLVVMYGQTEATARISYMPYEMLHKKPDNVGVAIPGGKIWIQNEQAGECVAPYVEGEIIYEGKNVSLGYAYTRADLSKGDERNGTLHTGDYGYLDEDGYLYIKGRKDRQVKIFGNRIDLDSLEKDICEKYGSECICSIKNEKFIVKCTFLYDEADLCNYVSKLLGIHKNNIEFEYIKKLYRNEIGKVNYSWSDKYTIYSNLKLTYDNI